MSQQLFYTDLRGEPDTDLTRHAQGSILMERLVNCNEENDAGIAIETFDEKTKEILTSGWQNSLKGKGCFDFSNKTFKLIKKTQQTKGKWTNFLSRVII